MRIKNSYGINDIYVYSIDKSLHEAYKKYIKPKISEKQEEEFREMAKELSEQIDFIFKHELQNGWEEKIFNEGKLLDKNGKKALISAEEIRKALDRDGEIQFFAHPWKMNGDSIKAIEELKK